MVTPLQLDGKINRPAASKTQARDLETPPFADILSALSKPAQKEKEVSPETIAAAIAAMQTRPVQFVEILPEPASVTEAVTIAPSNARSQANRPVAVSPLPEAGVAPEAAPAQNVEVESNPTNPIQVGVESGKKKEKKASSTAKTESSPKLVVEMQKPPAQAASVPVETPAMPQVTGKPIETVIAKAETPDPAPRQAASVPAETPGMPQATGKPIETVTAKAKTPDPAPRQAAITESRPKMIAQAASVPAETPEMPQATGKPIETVTVKAETPDPAPRQAATTESSPKIIAQAAIAPAETPAMPQVTGKPIETVTVKAETPDPALRQAAITESGPKMTAQAASVPAETPARPSATGKPIETVTAKAETPDLTPRQAATTEFSPKITAQAASVPVETPARPQVTGKPIETVTAKAETPDPAPRQAATTESSPKMTAQAASALVETPEMPQVTGKPIETVTVKAETPDPAPRQAAITESSPKMTAHAASVPVETPEMPQVTGKSIETVTVKAETPDPAPRQAAITESSPKMVEQPAQTMFFGVESGSKDEKLGSASAQTVSDDAVAAQNDMGLQQIRVADDAKVEKTGVEKDFSMPDGAGIQQKVANAAVTGRTDGADSVLPVMQKNEPAKGEPVVQDEKSSRAFFKKDERKVGDVEKSSESGKLAAFGSPLHTQAMGKPDANFAASHSPVVDVAEQVARQLSTRLQPGMGAMRLELHPQELGAIDVQVARGPQGVSVTFFAEQPATGRLLEAQMGQLRQSLSDAGVQLAGLNVGQQRQEGGGFQQNPFARAQQVSAPVAATSAEEPDALAWQAGRIDYRV